MRKRILLGLLFFVLCVFVGCEWEKFTDDEIWFDRFAWANFTGIYRGPNGGLLVTDYSVPPIRITTTPGDPGQTNQITGELVAYGNGSNTVFSGNLDGNPVVPGTLSISTAGYVFSDAAGDGTLVGTAGTSGEIVYDTGAWALDFAGGAPGNGVAIVASYQYTITGTTGTTITNKQGNSGPAIYVFYVTQLGEELTFTDNAGAVYKGYIITVQTSTGITDPTAANGLVWAQFVVYGTGSRSNVRIEGLLAGRYTPGSRTFDEEANNYNTTISSFGDMVIDGAWYEQRRKKLVVCDVWGYSDQLIEDLPEEDQAAEEDAAQ